MAAKQVFSQPLFMSEEAVYRGGGTRVPHLQENASPIGPHSRPMPRVLGGSYGGGRFIMGEVPLYPIAVERIAPYLLSGE